MAKKSINLAQMFQTVTSVIGQNQEALNQADDYNHNHGDNMVEIFKVITQAMEEKKNASPADQLEYASQLLREKSKSGSAAVYSEGLARAAQQVQGKKLTQSSAMELITALMGTGLQESAPQEQQDPLSSMVGSLLSGLTEEEAPAPQKSGMDASDLLKIGMALMQADQRGAGPMETLVDVMLSNSRLGTTKHRAQSGKLVANTLIKMIGSMGSK